MLNPRIRNAKTGERGRQQARDVTNVQRYHCPEESPRWVVGSSYGVEPSVGPNAV